MFSQFFYDLMIRAYRLGIGIASLFNKKAKLWVQGRANWSSRLDAKIDSSQGPVYWIHAASLGEFEQGRPVIEAIRKETPNAQIVLTFFSPSGYEIRKGYHVADVVTYLPLDTKRNAQRFIDIVKPDLAIFIKYEFWFNFLMELKSRSIPTILVSGRFYEGQNFFKPWGAFFRKGLEGFNHFFLQNEESGELMRGLGILNFTVNGDTRYDRVMEIRNEDKSIDSLQLFCEDRPTIMLGSSWPYDEILLEQFIRDFKHLDFKVVVAPHEIDGQRIQEFRSKCTLKSILLSEFPNYEGEERMLIIDSIGILAQAYKYCDIAIVGGGFGAGIHNVLEPAVWGLPVVFGPRYEMFKEAVGLVNSGGGVAVELQSDYNESLSNLILDEEKRKQMGSKSAAFCDEKTGATQAVMTYLAKLHKIK